MHVVIGKLGRVVSKAPVGLVVIATFAVGYWLRGAISDTPARLPGAGAVAVDAEATVWTCSMHPEVRLPRPGPCPKCGMTLVPEEKKPPVKSVRVVKYACSMFCVPPMERPGKCPICGMKMVAVENDGGGGGGDGAVSSLTLSPAAQKLAEIMVAPVERKFVSATIRLVGKVDYDETRVAYLTAWVPGRLERLYVDYTGVPVEKGDHMVELYSPDLLAAQEELTQAIKAVRDLRKSAVPSMRETASQTVVAVREKLRLWGLTPSQIEAVERDGSPSDRITIHAPIGGIVIHKYAVEGMYVETGTRIYTIADLSHVWVKLDAYESDLGWIRYGQHVEFETEAYPGETFTGRIAFIDPVLDARTRTVKVRLNVPNPDGRLKPAMFVRARILSKVAAAGRVMEAHLKDKWVCYMHPEIVKDGPGSCDLCGMNLVPAKSRYLAVDEADAEPPLVIPASAPLITGKRAVVYVATPDQPGRYEGREIVLGPRAGDYYLVREGLAEGEMVVVNGNFKIDSAVQIRAQRSMMNPQVGSPAPVHDHGQH